MPRLLVRLFAEEAGATQRHCCIHTSAERSQKAMVCGSMLIHNVVATIDVEGLPSDQPRCIVSKKSGRHANIVDADKASGRRLGLGFVQECIEFRYSGGRARRQWTGRNCVHANPLWP